MLGHRIGGGRTRGVVRSVRLGGAKFLGNG